MGGRGSGSRMGSGSSGGKLASAIATGDQYEVRKQLYEQMDVGDVIYVTEDNGREYPYTLVSKNNRYPDNKNTAYRMEFEARLPGSLTPSGYTETVKTAQMDALILNGRRKWRMGR